MRELATERGIALNRHREYPVISDEGIFPEINHPSFVLLIIRFLLFPKRGLISFILSKMFLPITMIGGSGFINLQLAKQKLGMESYIPLYSFSLRENDSCSIFSEIILFRFDPRKLTGSFAHNSYRCIASQCNYTVILSEPRLLQVYNCQPP